MGVGRLPGRVLRQGRAVVPTGTEAAAAGGEITGGEGASALIAEGSADFAAAGFSASRTNGPAATPPSPPRIDLPARAATGRGALAVLLVAMGGASCTAVVAEAGRGTSAGE